DEAEQHSWAALNGSAVERHPDRSVYAHCLAGESFFAPEGAFVDRVHLRVGTHRRALGELVAQGRKQRFVFDPRREGGRNRHDHLLCGDATALGEDLYAFAALSDPPHGRVQSHAAAEFGRDSERYLLAAADEAIFLSPFSGLEVAFEGSYIAFVPR